MDDKILISKKDFERLKSLELENEALKIENAKHEELIKYLQDLISLNKLKDFGNKSEKSNIPDLNIFNEAERTVEGNNNLDEYTIEEIDKNYKKKTKNKKGLKKEKIVYDILEEEKVCDDCGGDLYHMKDETRDELVIIPARVSVKTHVTKVYGCKNCEKTTHTVPMIRATAPEPLIKGSLVSPEAVAHIVNEKFAKGVPYYRLSENLSYDGISISRQTMSNWLITCTDSFFVHIYNLMKEKLVEREVLHADETSLQVLREPGKKPTSKSYMWVYRTSGDTKRPIVLFEYQPSREHEIPKNFLKNFSGFLHTDGYEAYHKLKPEIVVAGCWIHARRKFMDALKVIPKDKRKGSNTEKGFLLINKLFSYEREFENLNPEERYEKRASYSKKTMEELFTWAKTFETEKMPKSLFKTALVYLLNQKVYLCNVLVDGRLELTNNRAERTIKPFVTGRKNWIFCVSQDGAFSSSVLYSLVETAKENNLSPYKYIKFLLENIPNTKTSELENLLPWAQDVKSNCRGG